MKGRSKARSKKVTRRRPAPRKRAHALSARRGAASAASTPTHAQLALERDEALEQQAATAGVLKLISRATFDLQSVLDKVAESAARLCDADMAGITREHDGAYYYASVYNYPVELHEFIKNVRHERSRGSVTGRALLDGKTIHIPDVRRDPEYTMRDFAQKAGLRTILGVPLLRDDVAIGVIVLTRSQVHPFSEKQIELVRMFADQAVIAIENARLLNALRQRTADLTESLEQQTATSEVLSVISKTPGALEPVFNAMLEKAVRICNAGFGNLWLRQDDCFRIAATYGAPRKYLEHLAREPLVRPSPGIALDRITKTKQVYQIADVTAAPTFDDKLRIATIELAGARTLIGVPMLKDDEVIGVVAIYRQEVRPFTDKQIALVQNFANQAVIAIENARLLNELRRRTSDLSESLEQQTATSEVLQAISRTSGDLQQVFATMLENAARICDANFGNIFRWEGGAFYVVAGHNTPPAFAELRKRSPLRPGSGNPLGRMVATKAAVHIANLAAHEGYTGRSDPNVVDAVELGRIRTVVIVPMLKEDELIGAIAVYRQEERPFTEKQIALVTNFAAQAVIAIENARLLNELRQSLQQQTATADVLKVISRSAFDLQTVLHTLVESAAHLCGADKGTITRQRGDTFYRAEAYGFSAEFMEYVKDIPIQPDRGSASGRALLEGCVIHITDVRADPDYTWAEAQRLGDYRTIIAVPMLRDGVPIGVLTLTRSQVQPFTDKQIELVTTFADQASIAIENVRLFDEIQDKSRQLEEASQHKSQFLANMSHELRTPLNAILGYTELMADGAYGEPSERMLNVLKRLETNGRHLLGLINDVLDLSKIEAGQLVLELLDYSVQDIAQTVRSTLEPLAADKKLAFKVDVPAELPPGRGDGRRLTQVLINLVGNAIKFTDAGEVAIRAEANNGSFYVAVHDSGPGISAADQTKLFQEFQQADNAITKKKGGTGLGLAISKRIIEMHGGRIWVESQLGHGATFAFTLPVIVERQAEAVTGAQ